MKIKFYTALIFAKLTYLALKVMHRKGTSFAGYVALKLCPDFLKYTQNYINSFINITGTNGKTTTSGLISHIFAHNNTIISNIEGANMLTGIVNTLALGLNLTKKYDFAILETDEAFLTKVYDYIDGNYLTVTNLFPDQLDRYGDVDFTRKIIDEAISKCSNLKLILNADDEKVKSLGINRNAVYYGIEEFEYCCKYLTKTEKIQQHDKNICQYEAKVKIYDNYFELYINHHNQIDNFKVNLVGSYNAYNALAAITTALENGISKQAIQFALETFKPAFGRSQKEIINGKEVLIQLIKNPAGANEVLKTVDTNSNIIIGINNTVSDGKDISWLWDTDFEKLKDVTKPIVTSGTCAYEVATRLKYAGVPMDKIIVEPNPDKAIKMVTDTVQDGEEITLLPSYTVMWSKK